VLIISGFIGGLASGSFIVLFQRRFGRIYATKDLITLSFASFLSLKALLDATTDKSTFLRLYLTFEAKYKPFTITA